MSALDQAFIKAYRKQTDHWVSSHPPRRYAPPPVANQPLGVDLAHAQLFHPHVPFVATPVAPVYATPVYATAPQAIPVAMPQAAPVGAAAVHPRPDSSRRSKSPTSAGRRWSTRYWPAAV
jgi:hypothetical protein